MSHQLRIHVIDFAEDTDALILSDVSTYDPLLPKQAPVLQIKSPGFNEYQTIAFTPETDKLVLSALELGDGTSTTDKLGDGLYIINYAMSPHKTTNTTVYHFRVSKLLNLLLSKIDFACDIEDDNHNLYVNSYLYLQVAIYWAKQGKCEKAQEAYDKAYSLIKKSTNVLSNV